MNIDEIVEDVLKTIKESWSKEDRLHFAGCSTEDLLDYHNTLGRQIRNEYKLWSRPWEPDIVKTGNVEVDYSPYHPDQISTTIIEKVAERLNNEIMLELDIIVPTDIGSLISKQQEHLKILTKGIEPLTFWQQIKRLFNKWE